MKKLLLGILICAPFFVSGQYQKSNDIFPKFGDNERKGWIINPLLTYTSGPIEENNARLWAGSDSVYDVMFDAQGRVGFGIEVGRFYAIDNTPLISFVDFTIGYKVLDGAEEFEAIRDVPENGTPHTIIGGGSFNQSFLTASFNITNAQVITKDIWLKNTLGINGDYRITNNTEYDFGGLPGELNMPSAFLFQAHYSIGIGVKVNNKIMLVPSVETPILTFYEYDDLKSTLHVFNSRFRPFTFKLGVMLLDDKADRKCPKNKGSRKGKESLFGMATKRPW